MSIGPAIGGSSMATSMGIPRWAYIKQYIGPLLNAVPISGSFFLGVFLLACLVTYDDWYPLQGMIYAYRY